MACFIVLFYPTSVIPQSQIDPLAAFYVASFPNPNFLDPLHTLRLIPGLLPRLASV
jgi:hypothetical protein